MTDIVVDHVSKYYRVPSTTKQSLFRVPSKHSFWALKDVSFDVGRGETFGIVGPNGSGKSTLIKLLSRITAPSDGVITISGRLSALVELGAGFHPDLTGYENIFLSGSILGMSYREIRSKVSSIIEFAEIGNFIHSPVKRYSSGMFVRLAFSIAVHLDAEIMLFDEVLAVGDVRFQARCFERVEALRKIGKTIVLVSHDFAAIEQVCSRALLLCGGQVAMIGEPRAVIEHYQAITHSSLSVQGNTAFEHSSSVVCKALTFNGPSGGPVRTGEAFQCCLGYATSEQLSDVHVTLSFNWPSGYLCTQLTSSDNLHLMPGCGTIEFLCPNLTMQRGSYSVDILIQRHGEVLQDRPRCTLLRVNPGKIVAGDFYLEHSCFVRPMSQPSNDS